MRQYLRYQTFAAASRHDTPSLNYFQDPLLCAPHQAGAFPCAECADASQHGALEMELRTASAILQVASRVSRQPYTISVLPTSAPDLYLHAPPPQTRPQPTPFSTLSSPLPSLPPSIILAHARAYTHTYPSPCQFRMQWAAVSIHLGLISSPVHVVLEPPSFLAGQRAAQAGEGGRGAGWRLPI